MNHALKLSGVAALGMSACGQREPAPAAEPAPASEMPVRSDMSAMPMRGPQAAILGAGTGVIAAVDAEAGTVAIDPGGIPAVAWPAMVMAAIAEGLTSTEQPVGSRA